MSAATLLPGKAAIVYPDSDGKPMADNTLQFEWIVTIKGGLDALYRDDPNVFVAGDLLWYPVEGETTICTAPDAMVSFNRPKGYRGSYQQWLENNIPPQVVFEILSPGNRFGAMLRKFQFYERYGVEEYYIYDPDKNELTGYLRSGAQLREIPSMAGWVSPRLGIRFELAAEGLEIHGPDGRKFVTYLELVAQREQVTREKEQAQRQAERAQHEKEQAQRQAEEAAQQVERLKAQLRTMGVEPEG